MKKRNRLESIILNALFFVILNFSLFSENAFAARAAKVIVKVAVLHEFPQAKSKVIGKLNQDEAIAVSNKPIEGFYKTRLSTGELGWISGNDVLISEASSGEKKSNVENAEEETPIEKIREERQNKRNSFRDRTRLMVMYGIQNFNYGDLLTLFSANASELNPGKGFTFELQYHLSESFRWAIRVETFSAKAADRAVSANNIQSIQMSSIPILFGVNYSPISFKRFRLGVGTYLGISTFNSTTVQRTGGDNPGKVIYDSYDPCAELNLQGNLGLSKHIAFVFDFAYHYQKSASQKETQYFSTTGTTTPSFTIDYSGMVYRGGLEFRF